MKHMHLIILALLLLCPASLLAKPVEVLVFPNGAIVTELSSVTVFDGTATLTLPAVADTASLKIATVDSQGSISGLQFESVLDEDGEYQKLKDRIEATKEKLQAVEDLRQAKARTLDLWKAPLGEKFASADEYRKLAELMLTQTETLYQQHSQLARQKKEIEKELQELERKLADATNRQKRHWSVQVTLNDAGAKETLRYSYRVYQADWEPIYTLDARPAEKSVVWDWTAKVRQRTAADWNDVQLLLATAEPVFTLTPPENQPWIIREIHYYPAPAAESFMPGRLAKAAPMEAEMDILAEEPAPARKAGTLFDVYDLGRQTIVAGEIYQLNIRNGSWPAKFDYLVRPLQSPQVFLLAKLEFDELLPMPSGDASILVEGVFVGKKDFALMEKKLDLSFGNDPQIEVKVVPSREAAEEGLFGGDKSQTWRWRLDLTNNKNIPVTLRIEDSLPQIEDKRIELVEASTGKQDKEERLAKWEIELPAGAKKSVEYGYKITYPAEMQVELGR